MASVEVIQSVSYLLGLIDSRQWEKFRSYALEPSPAHFRARVNVIAQIPELNGMTLLHAAVKCDPPCELVLDMIQICPELIAATDCLGRTPLHVAAGCGAAPSLIRTLAHICPPACDIQDIDGKTPLHFACDSSCELFEEEAEDAEEVKTPRVPCHDTIAALLSESFAAATLEDIEEMNPLEHAIMSSAPLLTVKLLQHAAARHLKGSVPMMIPRRVSIATSEQSYETSMEEDGNRI